MITGPDCSRKLIHFLVPVLIWLGSAAYAGLSFAASATNTVIVNGIELTAEKLDMLRRVYPVAILPGRYWYDAFSGAYGIEGGPIAGQMMPGLSLGGPLLANASHGTTGVFVNGRQLTDGETAYIELACGTPVIAGRYWVNSEGLGGYEGGAPAFNLALCRGASGQNSSGGSSPDTYCDENGACTSTGVLGTITTTP